MNSDNIVVGLGYNGFPRGISDDEWSWESPHKQLVVIHAEANAILNSNQASLKGCRIYCPFFTCTECTKLIIQSGIAELIYCELKHYNSARYHMNESRQMYDMAGVTYRRFIPDNPIFLFTDKKEK